MTITLRLISVTKCLIGMCRFIIITHYYLMMCQQHPKSNSVAGIEWIVWYLCCWMRLVITRIINSRMTVLLVLVTTLFTISSKMICPPYDSLPTTSTINPNSQTYPSVLITSYLLLIIYLFTLIYYLFALLFFWFIYYQFIY